MKKYIRYQTKGTCSRMIELSLDDEGRIEQLSFLGGCSGNTAGIARLVVGMKAEDVIARVKGVRCGPRPTSCPDQLAQALERCLAEDD